MPDLRAFYAQHKDAVQVAGFVVIAVLQSAGLVVSRDSFDALANKVDRVAEAQGAQALDVAKVGLRVDDHERRLAAVEH